MAVKATKAKAKPKTAKKRVTKKPTEKKPVGRPTDYKREYNEQAYKLCLLGATHAKLADFFNVNIDTITQWINIHEEFSVSIKKGKYAADSVIAESLYERAKGCTVTKQVAIKLTEKKQALNADGEPTRQMVQTEKIEIVEIDEQLPPDTTAGIFWLKNRQPKEWRDKQDIDVTTKGESINEKPDYSKLSKEEKLRLLELNKKLKGK